MEMWVIWLIIIIVLAILEMITVGLTTIWFVISGIISLIISFFTDNYVIQFGVFVIVGVLLLVTTRPLIKKTLKENNQPTNADRIIGMTGVVTERITKNNPGEVKVDGKKWTAISDKTIKEESIVKVLSIKGVKIEVEKVSDEE